MKFHRWFHLALKFVIITTETDQIQRALAVSGVTSVNYRLHRFITIMTYKLEDKWFGLESVTVANGSQHIVSLSLSHIQTVFSSLFWLLKCHETTAVQVCVDAPEIEQAQ